MFLVRITVGEMEDWKVFQGLPDAEARFYATKLEMAENEIDDADAVLFQVLDETDARRALDRAKAGDAVILKTTKWTPTDDQKADFARLLAHFGPQPSSDEPGS